MQPEEKTILPSTRNLTQSQAINQRNQSYTKGEGKKEQADPTILFTYRDCDFLFLMVGKDKGGRKCF